MGLFSGIGKIISDFQGAGESYSQGENWAEATIEKYQDKELEFEVDEQAVMETAEEYAAYPESFYNGFREKWNEHVEEPEPEPQGFWARLFGS
jgi:hypothetical protein